MINILKKTIKSERGSAIVEEHLGAGTAQECWKELNAHYIEVDSVEAETRINAVSYTHLTLPTNREV